MTSKELEKEAMDVLGGLVQVGVFAERSRWNYANNIARDLNRIVRKTRLIIARSHQVTEDDLDFAKAVIRVVQRLAEAEDIEKVKPPQSTINS